MSFIDTYFYNDIALLPTFIFVSCLFLLILGVSIFFHELGHQLWFKVAMKKRIRIRFVYNSLWSMYWEAGENEDYVGLTNAQYSNLLVAGVGMGVLPILLFSIFYLPTLYMLIPYFFGSWKDLKSIIQNMEN